jgi:hypothetical protein
MRTALLPLFLLTFFSASSQLKDSYSRWHGGFGLTAATLNFHQNGITGFCFPVWYDLFRNTYSSLSLGTNFKIGTEDENGLLFPVVIAAGIASTVDNNIDGSINHQVAVYSDIPLLLHYNFGAGAERYDGYKYGYYLGGGFTQTFTGYTSPQTRQAAQTDFWAWVADGGIRIELPGQPEGRVLDLGFSISQPLRTPIGPIFQSRMYQLNIMLIAP